VDLQAVHSSLPFFVDPAGCASLGLSLAFPFYLPLMVLAINLLLNFYDKNIVILKSLAGHD
jgi:hypothetical protein